VLLRLWAAEPRVWDLQAILPASGQASPTWLSVTSLERDARVKPASDHANQEPPMLTTSLIWPPEVLAAVSGSPQHLRSFPGSTSATGSPARRS